jgi:hypothetical protein
LQGRLDWLRAGDAGPKGAQQEDTPKKEYAVMPAEAGIHFCFENIRSMDARFRGHDVGHV